MKDVFVTGGTGFIGALLVARLRGLGCRVRCLVRSTSNRSSVERLGAECVEGGFSSPEHLRERMSGVDTVFHLAGEIQARTNSQYFDVNQGGCQKMAEAAARLTTPPVVVSVSSLAAAGAAVRQPKGERPKGADRFLPRDETWSPRPFSIYGKSKLAGEREWLAVADRVPVTVVRPAIVFGPSDRFCFPLFEMVRKTPFFLVPGYRSLPYSFICADDLVDLILAAAERGERLTPESLLPCETVNGVERCSGQGIYFGAGTESPLFSDFGRMLALAVGRSFFRPVRCPPLGVLGTGAVQEVFKRLTGRRVPIDWEKAKESLGGPWYCSGDKARTKLGVPFPKTLQERLNETVVWYRANGWLKDSRSR